MHRKRWAAFALVALLPALAVCVDGVSPPVPTDQAAQLVLSPVFAVETGSGQPLPINAIRVTALLTPGDEVLKRQTFPVDPSSSEWTLSLEVPYSSELQDPRFYTVMELLNVSGGVETVEWSGRSRVMELSSLSQLEVQAVEVVRGPVANLDVTGVAVEPHDTLFEEGASTTVSARVDGSEGAVVFWESSDPAVATVVRTGSREAEVSFLRPGGVTVTALAGTARATTRFRAVQRPDSVVLLPGAALRLTSLQDTARLRAVLVDPRGDSLPGESFSWSVPEGAPVRHLGGGAFLALRPGVATVTAVPDRAPELAGTAELTVAQVARSVEASPGGLFLPELGADAVVTATAADARGFPVEGAAFSFRSLDPAVATVDGQGRITAVASGITGVVVSLDEAADTVGVTVSEALDRIEVTPASHTFTRAGDTLRYRAVAVARDGTPIPSLTGFRWAVDRAAVATVDAEGLVRAVEDGRTTVTASLDDVSGTAEVLVERVPARVLVSPGTVRLEALGATARLTAAVVDEAGDTLRRRGVTWSSASPAVVQVSEDGTVTAVGNGTARVEARAGDAVGSATVSVAQELRAIALRPDSVRLEALGVTGQLQAVALDGAGQEMAPPDFTWASSDTLVVRVDATGTFRTVGNGVARISATAQGVTGSAPVVVEQVAHRVEVDPPSFTFVELGRVQAFVATVFDANDHEMTVDELVWSSSDTLVVRVTQEGEASAEAEGSAVLSVQADDATGSAEVTVAPERTVARVVLTPDGHAFTGRGQTQVFTATALDGDGEPLPDAGAFAWSSTDPLVVSVAPDGTATAVAPGSATVRATLDGVFGEAGVTVKVPPASVEVLPAAHTFTRAGETLALEAVVRDADGFPVPEAAGFLWRSDALAVVRVGAGGVAEAVDDGVATVTAAYNGLEGSATLTVARVVDAVAIEPASPATLTFFGQTLALRARITDAAGELILQPAAWRSLDPGVATVDGSGVVTAVAEGTARIEASRDGVAATVEVDVAQAVSYVEVSPRDRTFNASGQTQTFTARAFDAGANPVARVTSFAWTTTDPAVASVAPSSGASTVVTSGVDGTAEVTATAEGVAGTAPVRVDTEVASVAISPRSPRTLTSFGETLQLAAVTRDILGNPVGATVTWSETDPTVATVDPSGRVTAVGNGSTDIVATSEGKTDRVTVTVAQTVGYVSLTPGAHAFRVLGDTVTFGATAHDPGGTPVDPQPPFTWNSGDAGVATVAASGPGTALVTAAGDGVADVRAEAGGVEGAATVTVGVEVASLEISPKVDTLRSLGDTVTFTAVARDGGGSVVASAGAFGWAVGGSSLSLSSATGPSTTATATKEGVAKVYVYLEGVLDSALVHVDQVATTLEATPEGPHALTAVGQTLDLDATLRDALGNPATGTVVWSSDDPSVVSVDPATGLVRAEANGGPVDVVATSGALADTVSVGVAQEVTSLTLTPASLVFSSSGETGTLVATAQDANGNEVSPVPALTWTTSDGAVATVGPDGEVTAGTTDGSAQITARTASGVSAAASVTVGRTVASIEITPADTTLRARGALATLTAVAKDGLGSVIPDVTSFSWSSDAPGVAAVAPVGTDTASVKAVADGTATISASAGGVTGTTTVTVERVAAAVTVTPDPVPDLTFLEETRTLSAEVTDSLGEPMDATVAWSTAESFITVDGGKVTAVAEGSGQVVATAGSAADTVTVTVAQAPAFVGLAPDTVTLTTLGDTLTFTPTVFDAGGSPVASPSVTWSTDPSSVASVDASGLVTAVGTGEAAVTARAGDVEGVGVVRVAPEAADVVVTPVPIPTLTALDATVQLTGRVEDGAGNTIAGATILWASLDPTLATVSTGGLVTARQNGTARIEARYQTDLDTIADTVSVTVAQAVASVAVTPSSVAMAPGDAGVQLHAEARDANGHPVPGTSFAWSSLDGAVAAVDMDTGFVTPGVEGATTVEATADGVTGSASVQVTSGQVARTFTGTSSGDLLDPANWEPAGAPDADDELVLGAGTTASLSSDFSLGSLTLEEGATLDLSDGATLDLSGSLDATGGITGSGTVEMSGTGTITGTVPNLDVTGNVSVEGQVTVSGDLETADGGTLSMTEPTDQLSVQGDLLAGGGDTDGSLTSGTIYLSGQLVNVTTSFKTFNPSGDHTVVFNGTVEQTVTLDFPGENQHRFQNVVVDNPAGVVFATSIPILGSATIQRGALGGGGADVYTEVYGNIVDVPGSGWRIPTTWIRGAAPSLPASMSTDLVFPAATTLTADLVVAGDVRVTGSASNLNLGGHRLTATGGFEVDDSGLLTMVDGSSELAVTGDVRFGGRNTVGALSAGTVFVGADFHWSNGVKVDPFLPSGSHRVVFNGSGPQSIVYTPGGNRVFAFQDLTIAAGADVTPAGSLTVAGTMTVDGRFTVPAGTTLTVLGALDDAAGEVVANGTVVPPTP